MVKFGELRYWLPYTYLQQLEYLRFIFLATPLNYSRQQIHKEDQTQTATLPGDIQVLNFKESA